MQQDLRELFKKDSEEQKHEFRKGHETRLLDRLEEELPQKKKPSFYLLKIAASLVFIISLGYFVFDQYTQEDPIKVAVVEKGNEVETSNEISLGDLSPNFKKVENYYVANINLALSKLEVSEDNKDLTDSFMLQLSDLNTEYKKLNTELNQLGPNDQTITALIENLQLRLQLLQKLKKKLNELNTSKNEQIETNTI
jgi:hypothetical protein